MLKENERIQSAVNPHRNPSDLSTQREKQRGDKRLTVKERGEREREGERGRRESVT
jgi:hypothetical protein